jgi:hypothetical protein
LSGEELAKTPGTSREKRQAKRPGSHNPEKRGRKDSRRRDENKIVENALTTNRTRLKVRAVITQVITNEYRVRFPVLRRTAQAARENWIEGRQCILVSI